MSWKRIAIRALRYIVRGTPNIHITSTITVSSPTERLKGKKIIVTGGSSGIGASMAKKFVEEGARVIIVGRNEKRLSMLSNEIGCEHIVFDLTIVR